MRTFASIQSLEASLAWIDTRNSTHLKLIVDFDEDSVSYCKCIKLGSETTCISYMNDNNGKSKHWHILSYSEAKSFHIMKSGQSTSTNSTEEQTMQQDVDVIDTTEDSPSETQKQTVAPVKRVYGNQGSIAGANAIAELIQHAINGAMDLDALKAMAEEKINEAVRNLVSPTIISYQANEDSPVIPVGTAHVNFPMLLQACQARDTKGNRLNILLVGPAGTSKSTAAEQVATAMQLSYYPISAVDSKFELFGFVNATGGVVRTAFREAWEHGGVLNYDELSASSGQVFTAFNGCLANGLAPFPDGAVKRHPDCVIVAGDNVFGAPTAEYNGRNKMDAATMDRFVVIDWEIDPVLERAITANDSWVDLVQSIRQAVIDKGIRGVIVTPRASVNGAALLRGGMDRKQVARMTMRKSMNEDQWKLIEKTVGL